MDWGRWLRTMCPSDWTDIKALEFINIECPEVTLEQVELERYALSA